MTDNIIKSAWHKQYANFADQFTKIKRIKTVATAFNTNIDAVIRLDGQKITALAQAAHITLNDLNDPRRCIHSPKDVVRGLIKCFTQGIAEEWTTDNAAIYPWLKSQIGYDRLQMGGQAGIMANLLSLFDIPEVIVHTASHPTLQAEQFLKNNNIRAFDQHGKSLPAHLINRSADQPLIHWIIEFSKDDHLTLDQTELTCPKSNRFIATYDPANLVLQTDPFFIKHIKSTGFNYLILSGYHNLSAANNGRAIIEQSADVLRDLKASAPQGIIHLELASTQDKQIRRDILEKIAPFVDSIGLNEREMLDFIEVIDQDLYQEISTQKITSLSMLKALRRLKKAVLTPRIQLHMYGLYMTLLDSNFPLSAPKNINGMLLASVVAASKAALGALQTAKDLTYAQNMDISDISVAEMNALAEFLDTPEFYRTGITELDGQILTAVPVILIDKPKTLVGMGDTISCVSLIGAQ